MKWLTRYPYYPEIHDATREFGRGGEMVQHSRVYFTPHRPMLWYNQRPLIVGQRLLMAPVDTNSIYCIDRSTGMLLWSKEKEGPTSAYLLGMTGDGLLAVAFTGRAKTIGATKTPGPVQLLNLETGETVWEAPDSVMLDDSPTMKHYVFASPTLHWQMNESWFEMTARPHMTTDGRVYLPMLRYVGYPIFGYISSLGVVDLKERKVVDQRRYYSGEILARADTDIHTNGPEELKAFEDNPAKDDKAIERIAMLKEVVADTPPGNRYGPFLPFERATFERYGVPFQLRISAREVEVAYDRAVVQQALAKRNDPLAKFAKAELAIADAQLDTAATLLVDCLSTISSEDVDFRAAINQQLYRVHQRLARRAIRAGNQADELANCLGMSRTASTLAEEIETLFAVADAYQRQGNVAAGRQGIADDHRDLRTPRVPHRPHRRRRSTSGRRRGRRSRRAISHADRRLAAGRGVFAQPVADAERDAAVLQCLVAVAENAHRAGRRVGVAEIGSIGGRESCLRRRVESGGRFAAQRAQRRRTIRAVG